MDKQKIIASIFFLLISSVMLYGFLYSEKAFGLLKKVYDVFGIKLDFTQGGKRVVQGIFLILCLVFLIGNIVLIFF